MYMLQKQTKNGKKKNKSKRNYHYTPTLKLTDLKCQVDVHVTKTNQKREKKTKER